MKALQNERMLNSDSGENSPERSSISRGGIVPACIQEPQIHLALINTFLGTRVLSLMGIWVILTVR